MTPYEEGRLFAGEYAGKRARLCLANNTTGLGLNGTTAQWDAIKLSGNGYADYVWTIPAGSYNTTKERYEAPVETAQFQASANGVGLNWNAAYLVIGTISGQNTTWNTGISFLFSESPNIVLSPGEPKSYTIQIFSDGFLVAS